MALLTGEQLDYAVNGHLILKDVSFTFDEGDWVTIIGPSGSGKSTLLKIIAGLLPMTGGSVFLEGKNMLTYDVIKYRQRVSYATQSVQLFGETVRDNLSFPFTVRGVQPDVVQQVTGLEHMALPADYLERKVIDLSGGERQRIGVLRHLLFLPQVLLLDEISTGLDQKTKVLMWQGIHQLYQTKGLVLSVTHDESEIRQADRLKTIMIAEGRIVN
jgi:putative ABC transport system ATP-binding protein